ncbi:uncharacterized protein LOC126816668 isoform X1 [Patella vulgata]|uniref:uncharacterized protein LOC126816668 isoform X1 n=1 Tax=Patella vulgata TaxID=6465 RepID=UPI00217FD578|nr:uncharacterized protein LOC126816668 isoform X1 [Patella vulgata]
MTEPILRDLMFTFAIFKCLPFVILVTQILALKNGIDRGPISCDKGKSERIIRVEKGDFGEIRSALYPSNYSVDLYSSWCQIEIKSCSTCKVQLQFVDIKFPKCEEREVDIQNKSRKICIPGCDHLHLHEVDYPYSEISHNNYHRGKSKYISISSNIRLYHCMSNTTVQGAKKFKIKFEILDKYELKQGMVDAYQGQSSGFVMSPNFPKGYAMNGETFSYLIQNLDPYGHVRLLFDDWDVSPQSEVKVYDGLTIHSPSMVLNLHHRPVMLSESNTIFIVFSTGLHTNGCCHYSGFKAAYQFVSEKVWTDQPVTDCSGIYPMKSGRTIDFTGLASAFNTYFDCVWIIKRQTGENQPDGVVLRMGEVLLGDGWIQYSKGNYLEIREGVTSDAPVRYRYTAKNLTKASPIFTTGNGFYIRLRGGYYSTDKLQYIYTSYKNVTPEGCPSHYDFLCTNLLCIDQELMCDGIDHCGDGSDESPILDCSVSALWRLSFRWSMPYVAETTTEVALKRDKPCYNGFMCVSGRECITKSKRCDGLRDCIDGSDEHRCYTKSTNDSQRLQRNVLNILSIVLLVIIL